MIQLAEHDLCTGCGACMAVCAHDSITMQSDAAGVLYPVINTNICKECHLCESRCPILKPVEGHRPRKSYACWNNIDSERNTSASGGIAIAFYEDALKKGYVCVGASQNEDFTVTHKLACSSVELKPFKNSKYVFSNAYEVFTKVKVLLKEGQKVIIIGIPCQIAAFRRLFLNKEHLLLVDIVCHGSTPVAYLQQHIASLEQSLGYKACRMSFRAPEKGTSTYHFTLYDEDGIPFYSKRSADGDSYNIGFHRSISYRENCYHCQFSCPERVGDITLGDYHGLGILEPCSYSQEEVSVMLINTEKGEQFANELISSGAIHADIRPIEEAIQGDLQLQRPSPKTSQRYDFEHFIVQNHMDFEKTMTKVLALQQRREAIARYKELPNRVVRKILKLLELR